MLRHAARAHGAFSPYCDTSELLCVLNCCLGESVGLRAVGGGELMGDAILLADFSEFVEKLWSAI